MTTKTPLPVSPKRIHDVDAFQVVRVGSDGMVYVRVEGEERAYRLAVLNEGGELRLHSRLGAVVGMETPPRRT